MSRDIPTRSGAVIMLSGYATDELWRKAIRDALKYLKPEEIRVVTADGKIMSPWTLPLGGEHG